MKQTESLITASLPITMVTVLEDRAMITRSGIVELSSDFGKYTILNVSPVISDTSLKVSVHSAEPESHVKIADCKVSRALKILKGSQEEEYSALCEKIEDNDDRLKAMSAIIALMGQEAELNSELLEKTLQEASDDIRWGRPIDPFLGSNIEGLESELTEMAEKCIALSLEQNDLSELKDDLMKQLSNLSSPSSVSGASIEFQLVRDESTVSDHTCRKLEVKVEYMVPGACWRPRHEAFFEENGCASFSSSGCVWQNTGEDWNDVDLLLSTERPSLGTSAPLLDEDLLIIQKKQEKKIELREQEVSSLSIGGYDDEKPSEPKKAEMPGIDDGGAVRLLKSASKMSVRSDGRPVIVPLESFSADYTKDLVIFPEISEAAYERVILKNKGVSPLLAGPVYLVKEGSYCGRTSTLYVASDEKFKLGLGTDPSIRCKRSVFRNQMEQSMLSRWVFVEYVITLKISSLSPEPRELLIEERIPVSEIDDVKIKFNGDETTGGTTGPDKHGKVKWELSLPSHGTKTIKLRYTVEKKADVDIL
jgi:uncharacterized protein (TIGR02231 family)